jgi:3-phosphoshikimate 1-carboxyvinyltransferase
VLQALQAQGTRCHYLGQEGYPPVEITGSGLTGGAISIDASQSSQFLSAMLLVSPCARSEMRIGWKDPVASLPYVHLTLSMMQQFGIRFEWLSTNQVRVPAPQPYQPRNFEVEGDCSSASYFWAAAALTGGRVTTSPVFHNSSQGDCRFLTILERMGCQVTWGEREVTVAGGGRLHGLDLDMNEMPDMVPTLAVVAAFADGTTRIRNVAHLRIKESDRLQVVALELSKLGVVVEELFDGLVIQGGKLHSAAIEAHDDHRIAMAFALAGLRVPGVEIHGAEAVAKSFPSFWDEFDRLCASS